MSEAAASEGIRLSGVRAVVAQRMMESLRGSAQLTYFADADITDMLAKRRDWKHSGHSIGLEDCVMAALVSALRDFPDFNALLEDEVVRVSGQVDISVAISSPAGLMTPVVRRVDLLTLSEIAERRRDLVTRAQAGRLKVSEMKGGTITLSNLGLTRVRHFTPILNAPQIALLGLGRIEDTARPDGAGGFVWRKTIGLSLTTDHRAQDGDPSGRFLAAICNELEKFAAEP